MMLHPSTASALASEHRRDMITRAARASQASQVSRASRRRAAASPRGPRRSAPRAYLPRYRVSWSRTTLSAPSAGGRSGRSWVIVISATRGV
jgi:hypothetical protein